MDNFYKCFLLILLLLFSSAAAASFLASYCSRILFLKDGRIFHELVRGEKERRAFLNEILDVMTLTGGERSHDV